MKNFQKIADRIGDEKLNKLFELISMISLTNGKTRLYTEDISMTFVPVGNGVFEIDFQISTSESIYSDTKIHFKIDMKLSEMYDDYKLGVYETLTAFIPDCISYVWVEISDGFSL